MYFFGGYSEKSWGCIVHFTQSCLRNWVQGEIWVSSLPYHPSVQLHISHGQLLIALVCYHLFDEIAHLMFQNGLYCTVSLYFFRMPRMLFVPVIGQLVRRCENFVTILAGETSLSVHRQVVRPHIRFDLVTFWAFASLNFQTQKVGVLVDETLVVVLHNKWIAFDWLLDFRSFVTYSICFGQI